MKQSKLSFWLGSLGLAVAVIVQADRTLAATTPIQFPDEELAAESVLPVFDENVSVKNRNVETARRIEIGAMGGHSLTEPFFNPWSVGGTLSYHIDETHGVNLFGLYYLQGASDYSRQLNPIPNTTVNANLQLAPEPKYLGLVNYQFTAYYGKLSLTKDAVMNLSLYGLLGGGMINIGDESKPVASVGLGQKFYFNSSFALRFDLRFLAYQGPDVLSRNLSGVTETQPAAAFDQKMRFDSILSFGAVFLLPKL